MHIGCAELPDLLRQLYAVVDRLEALYPGRRFTPDGHLVGSIGEVVAAHCYGLTLSKASLKAHDAIGPNGLEVQVKLTGGKTSIVISQDCAHLIAMRLVDRRQFVEIYNGPGAPVWAATKANSYGTQRPVALGTLKKLNAMVADKDRLPQLNPFPF